MNLDFAKLPRFKESAKTIWTLIPQWAYAHQVGQDAIINQIYIAHAWADSNPMKAPKKNVTRYLFNWMGNAKRHGNLKTTPKPVPKLTEPEGNYDMTFEEMQAIRKRNMPARRPLDPEAAHHV